ncbi:MAG: pirin family protein [Candidatus Marinimicrobia bacterium]|nr:pirin family protein [Candidatus Neomarinimicrobiota bacterium]
MRSIKQIHKAEYSTIQDLITWSPLPTRKLDQIDPFLFLNHHGPQKYQPNNTGLPFGPHPHRGMETVTFILDGDIAHKDSDGNKSVIDAGGVQWMTAGRGLIHAEISSEEFKEQGGDLEILQLWLNLPKRHKMKDPYYRGLQADEIPSISLDDERVTLNLVSGQWNGTDGAFESITDVFLSTVEFEPDGQFNIDISPDRNIFFYVIRGELEVNGTAVEELHLVEFENDAESLEVTANKESILLFGHAEPLNEPVVARGPFVMNTEGEVRKAYEEYQQGKFGTWDG